MDEMGGFHSSKDLDCGLKEFQNCNTDNLYGKGGEITL